MSVSTKARIDVQLAVDGDGIPDIAAICHWVRLTLDAAEVVGPMEVSVRIIDSHEMQSLNRRYRDRDKPTNVLSFPAGQVAELPPGEPRALGDIAVCAPLVLEEAAGQGKPVEHHWAHMLVHGTLHLLGYDHENDGDAHEMERLEVRILELAGISNPYIESCDRGMI